MRKEKSKRKGETIIGKVIYASLLFAPLISIAVTCLYTIINKNAYESYYGETINQTEINNINDYKDLKIEETYEISCPAITEGTLGFSCNTTYFRDLSTDWTATYTGYITAYKTSGTYYLQFYQVENNTNTFRKGYTLSTAPLSIEFTFNGLRNTTYNDELTQYTTYKTYNKYSFLDNSFEYGMYKVEQNNLYNWAKSTGTYNVVLATCQGIGITNTFTPMLLTYWFMISIIYFIYDIGLILIMILHRKIHEFEDTVL